MELVLTKKTCIRLFKYQNIIYVSSVLYIYPNQNLSALKMQ